MTTVVLSRRASYWFRSAGLVPVLAFGGGGLVLVVGGPLMGPTRWEAYLVWVVLVQLASGFDILVTYWLPRLRRVVLAGDADLERGGAEVLLWPVIITASGPWVVYITEGGLDALWGWPVLWHCALLPLVLATAWHRLAEHVADRLVDEPPAGDVVDGRRPEQQVRRGRRLRARRSRRRRLRRRR